MRQETQHLERADELAKKCLDAWNHFEETLRANKRKYPLDEFKQMFTAFERYFVERSNSPYIHRQIAEIVHTAHMYLVSERTRVPDYVFKHSQRMTYMLFSDHDPLEDFEISDDDDD